MLIIAIHGFRTLLKPGVWTLSEKVVELLRESGKYANVKLVELGYKHILYEGKHGLRNNKDGYIPTLKQILTLKSQDTGPLVILGHSLGGWAASLLTAELVRKGFFVDYLIQIDAMPLFTESLVFTEKWVEGILESDEFPIINKLLERDFLAEHKTPISATSNKLISYTQDLADSIEKAKIRPELIQSQTNRPYSHQQVFAESQVGTHYYYYVHPDAITSIDRLIHLGTGFTTGPLISNKRTIINVPIKKTHFLIDDDASIYDQCLQDLGVPSRLADLRLTTKLAKKKQDAEQKIIATKQKAEQKFTEMLQATSDVRDINETKQRISALLQLTRQKLADKSDN